MTDLASYGDMSKYMHDLNERRTQLGSTKEEQDRYHAFIVLNDWPNTPKEKRARIIQWLKEEVEFVENTYYKEFTPRYTAHFSKEAVTKMYGKRKNPKSI